MQNKERTTPRGFLFGETSGASQPFDHALTHYRFQILAPEPRQFLGEKRHALAIAAWHPGDVRPPEKTPRAECIEDPV